MTEAELQAAITEALDLFGWLWHHETDSRKSKEGFPDLFAVHPVTGKAFFAELKSTKGRVTPAQQMWADALTLSGKKAYGAGRYFLWRPTDLDLALQIIEGWSRMTPKRKRR